MTGHTRTITRSGLVWLGEPPGSDSAFPAIPRPHMHGSAVLRFVAGIAIALGLLSIPVNCALASGPHSIFIDPTTGVHLIVHVHQVPAPDTVSTSGQPRASSVPSVVTAVSVLVAVLATDGGEDAVPPAQPVGHSDTVPVGTISLPESPPPRSY